MPVGRNRFSGFPFRKGFRGLPGRGTWLQPKSWIKLQTEKISKGLLLLLWVDVDLWRSLVNVQVVPGTILRSDI